jgi:DNA-binding PucR family transcriptional regulator
MPDTPPPPPNRERRIFGFDPADPHDRLILETVNVYLRQNSQRLTAKEMHCSRSTVRKRLECFERAMERHLNGLLPPGKPIHFSLPE